MQKSATFQSLPPPLSVVFLRSCDKVYHKQKGRFILYLLGQIDIKTLIHWIVINNHLVLHLKVQCLIFYLSTKKNISF